MLDLGYVREHLDVIEKMARDRGVALDLAAFRELDAERRQMITSIERLKAERNKASEEIARLGKIVHGGDKAKEQIKEHPAGHEATLAAAMAERDALLAKMKTVSDEIKRGDERIGELDERLKLFLMTIPNIPHASVPVGTSAADNVEVRRWGTPPKFDFAPKPHWEIGEGAGILDFEAAIKIAGSRFAVYKGLGARLERALANFFLDVHTREHGFTEVLPPFLVNSGVAGGRRTAAEIRGGYVSPGRNRLVAYAHVGGGIDEPPSRRDARRGRAADQSVRVDGVFSLRGGRGGKRYARHQAAAPVSEGGDVQIHAAGAEL